MKKSTIDQMPPRPKVRPHAIDFSKSEDTARQEFKREADVNHILRKHGGIPPGRPPQYGVVDYDVDLLMGLEAVGRTRAAWARIPDEIRQLYPDWGSVADALNAGKLEIKGGKIGITPPAKPADPQPVAETQPKTQTNT